jgi:polyphosphate kinase 2 (PPK2 family)
VYNGTRRRLKGVPPPLGGRQSRPYALVVVLFSGAVDIAKHLIVKPGRRVRLNERDPEETLGFSKDQNVLERNADKLNELQHLLYADRGHALLIVLQGLDASGKDGTILHVMSGVNPQGCEVTSFKAPTQEELDHDFLWRIHKAVPGRGMIGIFNRSHYEDVLVVRVWSDRSQVFSAYQQGRAAPTFPAAAQ